MTISAYDRHGSDEHSALSEEQLSEQIDAGEQAGDQAGEQAGDQIGVKSASSRKVASKKTATKKKAVQKSIAKKSSKNTGAKKAGTKNTGAKSTGTKRTGAKNTGTKAANVKASPKNARNLSADKLSADKLNAGNLNADKLSSGKSVKKNAQAEDHLRAVLLLDGQIKALLQDQGGAGDKEAAKRRDAKVGSEATGLLWTLSALALAACGGGGGSGPAPVTGGMVQPRENETPPSLTTLIQGSGDGAASNAGGTPQGTPVGGDINIAGRPYLTGVLLGGDGTQPNKDVRDAAEAALSNKTDAPMPFSAILTDDLSTSGKFTVETAKIPSDKMISVAVGGIVDPLTGVQMKGGGVDAADNYQGPVWYSLQGSLLITPITDFIARKAALEAARDSISDINESSYYQDVIDDLFADVLREGDAGLTLADILDPKNYILPSLQDVDTLNQAQTSGSVLTDHLESVRIAKLVSEKALYIYGLQTDLYAPHNNAGLDDQKKAANTVLQNLIDKARAIEAGKPVAVPKTDLSVNEAQSDGGILYTFKLSDFGFRDLGGNADEENTPSQLASITITELPGRQDVPLRPNAAGEKVSALDITYDDFGTLYLIDEGEEVAVTAGEVITRADIEAGKLIFKPSKHFDRTASFKFSVNDGEQESDAVTLFIDINKQENSVYFYSPAIPDAQGTFKDEASEKNVAKQADAQPVEWVLQNGNPTDDWFAYQALADDPDTGDSFADVTYALKGGLDDDASLFKIDADSGKVTFITAPNHEKPHDLTLDENVQPQPDNEYIFTVIATSPDGSTAEQTVTLTVQDRNDEVQQGKIGTETYLHLGAGDYLEVVDDDGSGWPSITGGAARTFESWVRINNKASDAKPTILFAYGSADEGVDPNGQEKQWFIIEVNADGQLQLNTNIGGDRKTFTASLSKNIADNAWYHVAVTYDGTAFKIWLDNEEVFSENIALDTTEDARLRLGDSTHLFSGDNTKNGSVDFDNFRVWKKALSPEEIIASSRIHKYGSTDLNDSDAGFLGVEGLALELSFDQLKSTSDAWDNSGNGHYGKLGVEQSDELASKITEQIKTHDDPAFAEKADKIAVVVENAHLILSNEMFEISDEDAKDSDADIYFHLVPIDGKLQVYKAADKAWEDSGDNIFTLAQLKAGHVRFQHDGSENPNIEFQYSVYDGLVGGVGADLFVLDKGDAGTDIIADFSVLEGDKIRIDADENNDDTLAELGLAVADNGRHANIVDASDNSRIYLTLHNIDHTEITDTNFATYFEVV